MARHPSARRVQGVKARQGRRRIAASTPVTARAAKGAASRKPRQAQPSRGPRIARLSPDVIDRLFSKLNQAIPAPKSELTYASPFELLVAVILSAQATDKSVNLATARLYPVAHTPDAIFALGEAGLLSYIRTIGLAPTKAKNIIATCKLLLERHGGQVPHEREELEALPGVGRKTANVVLNTAFGQDTLAVDTHVFRVANRTGLAPGKTVRAVEDGLMKRVPAQYLKAAHHLLILHGRYTCKARSPACSICPISQECAWPRKAG